MATNMPPNHPASQNPAIPDLPYLLSPAEVRDLNALTNRFIAHTLQQRLHGRNDIRGATTHRELIRQNELLLSLQPIINNYQTIIQNANQNLAWILSLRSAISGRRNEYLRSFRGSPSYSTFIAATPFSPIPLSQIPDQNFCPYCGTSGHFPVNCQEYSCPQCGVPAPGHLDTLCPNEVASPFDALPVRPPSSQEISLHTGSSQAAHAIQHTEAVLSTAPQNCTQSQDPVPRLSHLVQSPYSPSILDFHASPPSYSNFHLDRRGMRPSQYQGEGPHPLINPRPHHCLVWGSEENYRRHFDPLKANRDPDIPVFWEVRSSYERIPHGLQTICHRLRALQHVLWALEFAVQAFDYERKPTSTRIEGLLMRIPLPTGQVLCLMLDFESGDLVTVHIVDQSPDLTMEEWPQYLIYQCSVNPWRSQSMFNLAWNPLLESPESSPMLSPLSPIADEPIYVPDYLSSI